jgi:hypothetical protein
MLSPFRSATPIVLGVVCALTLGDGMASVAAAPSGLGLLDAEPAFELAQNVPRPGRDGIPGAHPCQPGCREPCYRRYQVCILAARTPPAKRRCFNRRKRCELSCNPRCQPPGGPPLYPPPGQRQ